MKLINIIYSLGDSPEIAEIAVFHGPIDYEISIIAINLIVLTKASIDELRPYVLPFYLFTGILLVIYKVYVLHVILFHRIPISESNIVHPI